MAKRTLRPRNTAEDGVSARLRSSSAEGVPWSQDPKLIVHEPRLTREGKIFQRQSPTWSHESIWSHPESLDLEDFDPLSNIDSTDLNAPSSVLCFLHITFDGATIPFAMNDLRIAYKAKDSYDIIERIAQEYIHKTCHEGFAVRKLNFEYGNCTIQGEHVEKLGIPLTTGEEWANICLELSRLWTLNPRQALKIHIFRDYISHRSPSGSESSVPGTQRLELQKLMKRAADGRKYIPRLALMRFTSTNIRKVINGDSRLKLDKESKDRFIAKVHENARCLFALYIYAGLTMECLMRQVDIGYNDGSLPLNEDDCCHPKCAADFEALLERQGGFIAARFDHIGKHQDFAPCVVIPIHYIPVDEGAIDFVIEGRRKDMEYDTPYASDSEKQNACCGLGAFSKVYRVRIDPDHHQLSEQKDIDFALKEFKDRPQRGANDFKKELRILNELRKYQHEHIVTHLATWTWGGRYNMLFPYAQCNLREYMRWTQFGAPLKENIIWFLKQLCGLAEALKFIHDLSSTEHRSTGFDLPVPRQEFRKSAWHHDLKPDNILLYKVSGGEKGTFKIADFGSGKVHTYRSGSVETQSPNGTLTYEPPEALKEGKTSRPYDIWSLGCVFLELLGWAVWGHGSVEEFARRRVARRLPGSKTNIIQDDCFWQMAEDGTITLRIAVLGWLQDLEAATSQPEHQHFKDVVALIPHTLNPNQVTRITALDLCDTLGRIYQQKLIYLMSIANNMLPPGNVPEQPSSFLPRPSLNFPDHYTPQTTHDGLSTPPNVGFVDEDSPTLSPY